MTVDARDQVGGRTPLYLAAVNKQAECVKQLLEAGARLDVKCGKSTPGEAIRENLPYFDVEKVVVRQRPRENTLELLVEMVERRDLAMFRR